MKKINKIVEYGLYALVFLLPWQTRWIIRGGELSGGYLEYETISLYATDILLFLVIAFFIVSKIIQKSPKKALTKAKISRVWIIVGLLELFVFISIFFAPLKSLALFAYGRLLLGIGLFWLVTEVKYNFTKLSLSFIAGAALQAGLGIWQFVTQSTFACKYLGMASHGPGELGTAVIETIASDGIGERWLRAYGGLDHPNILGALLAIALLLLTGIIIKSQAKKWKYLYYSLWLILLLGLFSSFSRTAWLAFSIGLLSVFIISVWQKKYLAQKRILQLVLMGSFLCFMFVSLYGGLVSTRLSMNSRLEKKSVFERVASIEQGKKVALNNLFFGAGISNFSRALTKVEPGERSWYYQPVHNTFLLVLSEIGIFGLIGFISLVFYLKIGKKYRQTNNVYKFGIYVSLMALLFFDHFWWSLHFGVLLFWFILGLKYRRE
ncbi:O-antigen ligase family protein [Candidatus Parcubacteria bacterium]|nr:O-antigen ligase family protein [Candidatus Parcubacteria bacterium]